MPENPDEQKRLMKSLYYQLDRFRVRYRETVPRDQRKNLRYLPFFRPLRSLNKKHKANLVSEWIHGVDVLNVERGHVMDHR